MYTILMMRNAAVAASAAFLAFAVGLAAAHYVLLGWSAIRFVLF